MPGDPDADVTSTADASVAEIDAMAPADSPDAGPAGKPSRVVAIGDLHGDYGSALEAFRVGGLIDAQNHWIGGNAWAVQVGDQLDRGDSEPEILAFLDALMLEAEAAGGKLIVLNGNHELMNAQGNFADVTAGGLADYGGTTGRTNAFKPGGPEALRLAKRPIYAIVDGTVFAHGGVRPEYAADVAAIDASVKSWLVNGGTQPAVLNDDDGILWTRDFGKTEGVNTCTDAAATLNALGVERMVVAHTVQYGGISSICGGQVWRVDVGLSDYYVQFGAPVTQVLEIKDGVVKVLVLGP